MVNKHHITMNGLTWFAVVIATALQGCSCLTVILEPADTAREVGLNVTLACIVTNKANSESVQWKHKPENSDAFNALTFNENVLSNPSKYGIQWTYNLTIYNLEPQDAGLYRCTAAGVDHDATLTVVDLPSNVSIEMMGEPVNGETHNLTCRVTNSLPPPTITWLINGVDMTANAITENTTLNANGYGDIASYLSLKLDETMNGRGAECVLSYRGWNNAVKATYTIQTLYPGGYSNSGSSFYNPGTLVFPSSSNSTAYDYGQGSSQSLPSKGMFLIRFIKQSGKENINWELQQYQP